MNKTELVDAIAKQANLTKADAAKALEAFLDVVSETLQKKDKVTLIGFGTFETRERAARTGRNPQTGIAASTSPVFKPGKKLKESLNPHAVKAPAKPRAPAKKK